MKFVTNLLKDVVIGPISSSLVNTLSPTLYSSGCYLYTFLSSSIIFSLILNPILLQLKLQSMRVREESYISV